MFCGFLLGVLTTIIVMYVLYALGRSSEQTHKRFEYYLERQNEKHR